MLEKRRSTRTNKNRRSLKEDHGHEDYYKEESTESSRYESEEESTEDNTETDSEDLLLRQPVDTRNIFFPCLILPKEEEEIFKRLQKSRQISEIEYHGKEDDFVLKKRSELQGKNVKRSVRKKDVSYKEEDSHSEESETEERSEIEGTKGSKILDYRMGTSGEELLVKGVKESYLHIKWMLRTNFEEKYGHMGRMSATRFVKKHDGVFHVDSSFLEVERILHCFTQEDQTFYLVKWRGMDVAEITTELEDDLLNMKIYDGQGATNVEPAIKDLEKRNIFRPQKFDGRQIPEWSALQESPAYKAGNRLRSYQLEGLNWLVFCWMKKKGCIMADEMGLGKTIQSATFLNTLHTAFGHRGPFLIVSPLSTLGHWKREFEQWTDMNVIVYHGSTEAREIAYSYEFFYLDGTTIHHPETYKFDVVITTYEVVMATGNHLRTIEWAVGVFDEAHRLKNRSSKAAESLREFSIAHKVLLTGTPLQNDVEELWALLNFINPAIFDSEEYFLEKFGNLQNAEDVEKIQNLLKPIMLRRLKEDVEKSIPAKEETIVEIDLTFTQKKYYKAILENNLAVLSNSGHQIPKMWNIHIELRKCCMHPFLLSGAEEQILSVNNAQKQEDRDKLLVSSSGKMILLDKLLQKLIRDGRKALVFSQMTSCLDLIQEYLIFSKICFERIDGNVKSQERQDAIDRFSEKNSESRVFLLCTKAGGVGINLTAADTVIIFDSDWNPQNDIQAQARCHRIGQTKKVQIYRFIARNTYEREMFDRASRKLGLDKAVLQKTHVRENEKGPTKEEIESLLRRGAYGLLMEGDSVLNEDINEILERRSKVIRHDTNGEPSLFSKASFTLSEDVELEDPNFWARWGEKMNLDKEVMEKTFSRIKRERMARILKRMRRNVRTNDNIFDEMRYDATPWKKELFDILIFCGPGHCNSFYEDRADVSKEEVVAFISEVVKKNLEIFSDDKKVKEDAEKLILGDIERPADPGKSFVELVDLCFKENPEKTIFLLQLNHILREIDEDMIFGIPKKEKKNEWSEEDSKNIIKECKVSLGVIFSSEKRFREKSGRELLDCVLSIAEEYFKRALLEEKHNRDIYFGKKRIQSIKKTSAVGSENRKKEDRRLYTWSDSERKAFEDTILIYGIPRPEKEGWEIFRELSSLKKDVAALNGYLSVLLQQCDEALGKKDIAKRTLIKRKTKRDSDGEYEEEGEESKPKLKKERADKILRRIAAMDKIRMAADTRNEESFAGARPGVSFPTWWIGGKDDLALLKGVAKHGPLAQRIFEDDSLGFSNRKAGDITEAILMKRATFLVSYVPKKRKENK
eukprot:GHVN01033534.1.p1 GENE.GHVN01033534.1~~GHVN01033534.1.p1  ORF type:complete len:1313 (-),score=174.73 GHVN01033534.1:144-4082(-)